MNVNMIPTTAPAPASKSLGTGRKPGLQFCRLEDDEAISPTTPAFHIPHRCPATPTTTFKLNIFTAAPMSASTPSDRQSPGRSPRSAIFSVASSSRSHSRPSSNRASPVHFDPSLNGPNPVSSRLPTMNRGYGGPGRRQSRFDPMGQDDDAMDDDGYGELGGRHPLRRVHEDIKEEHAAGAVVSLPGIKALFGVADHPPTPASATSSLYQTPSLPSLGSPTSSPTTVRTSRYSSLNSSISVISETHSHPGWWAPGEDRFDPRAPRSQSFPTQKFVDEHDHKRRRSDQPYSVRDNEEAARLKWQASRNASLPSSSSSTGSISGPSGGPLRALLHPPPALSAATSAAMSRGSVSASPTVITPLTGAEFTFERRPSAAPRSASLVGGQLARSFADLTAADRSPMGTPSRGDMAPPPDRRVSMWLPPPNNTEDRSPLPSGVHDTPQHDGSAPNSRSGSLTPNPHLSFPGKSRTRPSSPLPERSSTRRSSLTELIMMKSGDDVTMAASRSQNEYANAPAPGPFTERDRPHHEPAGPLWSTRRASADSVNSATSTWNIDEGPTPSLRGRKRASLGDAQQLVELHQSNMITEPVLRGMDALAESARRVAAEERQEAGMHDMEGDEGGNGNGGAGPKYACAYCAKTFSRPSSLRIHTYSHTGERPFVCKEPSCRRRFSVQSNLKRHAKVHQMGSAGGNATAAPGSSGPPYAPESRPGTALTPTRHHPSPSGFYAQPGFYPSHEQGRYAPYPGNGAGPGPGRRLSNVGEMGRRGSREEDWTEEEDLEEDELDEDER